MKKPLLLFALVAIIFSACSVGVNKDLTTGLSYSYNGLSVDKVSFVGPDNTIKGDNVVPVNSSVAILMEGLRGFVLKDEKASPGLMLQVKDSDGKAIIDESDLFGAQTYSEADASVIRGSVTVGNPMKAGETYHVTMRVWDKNKEDNEITAEIDIVVR